MPWVPIWLLPNIRLEQPIGAGRFALTPLDDGRITDLANQHDQFNQFVHSFTDAFGDAVQPSVLLYNQQDNGERVSREAAAGFRDLLAISFVARARAFDATHPEEHAHGAIFSDYLAPYPWMTNPDFEFISAITPAVLGIHDAAEFNGQKSPDFAYLSIRARDCDWPLLNALVVRLEERYGTTQPTWENVALFRSLNMAYEAMSSPSGVATTFFDVGRCLGLWVAAFEILVHPGGNGNANRDRVFNLLENVPWLDRRCSYRRFAVRNRARKNIACWLYQRLYDLRNDFMHGNPVNAGRLDLPISNRNIFEVVPTLYRIGLTSYLSLGLGHPMPDMDDAEGWLEYQNSYNTQRMYEDDLLSLRYPRN